MANEKSTKKRDDRIRNFACMVYPESAPTNWFDILTDLKIPSFISPLHKDDIDPQGQPKKPHYHVMMMFEGKKSDDTVKEYFNQIGGVGFERVLSIRGYARYLCHLDNPEKAQYKAEDVKCLAGADYVSIIDLAIDKFKALYEMEEFCETYNVFSFYTLARYATQYRQDWKRVLAESGSIYMREYLQSRKWSKDTGFDHIIDSETGEVLI